MGDGRIVTPEPHELLTMVLRCLEWGNADLFALGRYNSIVRLGEIAGYIARIGDKDGKPRAESVRIVLPPPGGRAPQRMRDDVRAGVQRAFRRFETDEARIAPFVEATFNGLILEHATDFTSASLAACLENARRHQAVIVGDAAHYRAPNVHLTREEPHLPEDVWSAHLHQLMLMAEATARATDSYILLDSGERLPGRTENIELLKSAGDVGLCSIPNDDPLTPEDALAKVSEAYDGAAAGDIGKVLRRIADDASLSDLRKWLLRLVALDRAGLRDQVSQILDESADTIADLDEEHLLGVARIAARVDRDDFAQDLLERALPGLLAAHELEHALEIGRTTRRPGLIAIVRERLRALHPDSHLLRSVDARDAARDGDYARAADLLARAADAHERAVGMVFEKLAGGVGGPGFADPVSLARSLAREMPDWEKDIQREIMQSLERAGRRDEAVMMLFSGDIAWEHDWFIFAKGLLGRSLASGSTIVGPDVLTTLVAVGAGHLAEHPDDGHARTSIVDLLDAEHVGLRGLAVMMMMALESAERQPTIRKSKDPERRRLDDIGRLPRIMQHVMVWLAEAGNGIVVSGRHAIPAEILGEDGDAVLTGLLQLVDQYAPDPNDPADVLVMRNVVTVALAVAPTAKDRDEDLAVVRGAAIKLVLGGRPQMARDLAEQALLVAGDRPERRRRALAAFADIYARVGRSREALLALLAAFALPSEWSWRETWTELSVLLRLARDVGMADVALRIIAHLRRVLKKVGNANVYHSRLDTLELHAQWRKHISGEQEAWPLARLLSAATANAEAVWAAGEEALPRAMTLRQLIDRAEAEGAPVPESAHATLEKLTAELPGPHKMLVAAAGRLPDAATIAAVAGPIEVARYNDDVSYDLRLARMMGGRLARAATGSADAAGFAYAAELLSAQGVGVHGAGPEVTAAARLLANPEAPLAALLDIAQRGLPVVGLALDEQGLMAMTVTAAGAMPPIAVRADIFDRELLIAWGDAYPRRYHTLPSCAADEFIAATRGIGLPALPNRALILAGDLSRVPPNVLTVDGDLAGRTRTLATVPSLAWLKASLGADRKGDGSAAAWIPAGEAQEGTLGLLATELEGVLKSAGIALYTETAPPLALAASDLAILGGHGGLAENNRYFRGLSDDRHEPADLRQLTSALRRSRVAVLFVCSGGRFDQHPESGALVGIAHRLLDNGLDAVIAPAWPVPFTMTASWLSGFLNAWNKGQLIIDAYRAGNSTVARDTSHDLSRSLAMTLYGNPFLKR